MALAQLLPRFQRAYQALRELESREAWSHTELEAFQLERLNRLWGHARAHVPHYRRLPAVPDRFTSLSEFQSLIPALPKAVVRERPHDLLSEAAGRGRWARTGGSTGTPMKVFWGTQAYREMLQARYRMLESWGLDIFDRCAFLWGHGDALKPGLFGWLARVRQPLEDWLRGRIRLSAYELGPSDLRRHLARVATFRPASIYGYSQAMALLAKEAETIGFRPDGLKLAMLTAEPVYPHVVAAVERAFGVPAVVEYGSSECGFLAGEGPDRKLRVREDHVILESQPREDGRFDLILTVLTNPSFPLIRYEIGDVTDVPIARAPSGFAVLSNVVGRDNDLLVSRSGRPLHSARLEALFKTQTAGVRRYRVRQHRDGSLSADVEFDGPRRECQVALIERVLRELVEGFPVSVSVMDRLPVTPAGKHRLVVSEMTPAALPDSA